MDTADPSMTPQQEMNAHARVILPWFQQCTETDIQEQVNRSRDHPLFKEFQSITSHKFGERGVHDLVNFDMYLKKKCISDRIHSKPSPPADPSKANPVAAPAPPAPEVPAAAAPRSAEHVDSETNPEAYKNYWKKYEIPRGPTPNSEPTVATPDVKKRLDLDTGLGLLIWHGHGKVQAILIYNIVFKCICIYNICFLQSRRQYKEGSEVWLSGFWYKVSSL